MKNLKRFYYSLKLQTKLTITHLIIAVIPMLVLGIFFYAKLYDMIVADSIRTEQNASAKTAPLIEDYVQKILNGYASINTEPFYRSLVGITRTESLDELSQSAEAETFQKTLSGMINSDPITDVRIYLDIPAEESIFYSSSLEGTVRPISYATGTYWHGIFNGSPTTSSLFCPSFYLSSFEIAHYGELAFITKSYVLYRGEKRTCYTAIYYSDKDLNRLLEDNLQTQGSVAYVINERNSIVATSDHNLAGAYLFDYDTVQQSFMSSNNFIQKHVMGKDVYAGFYSIRGSDWYMVVAMPSRPIIEKGAWLVVGLLAVFAACIAISLLIATALSHSITNRLSAVINQMGLAKSGPPVPLPPSDTPDEIGDLIDSYNYMSTVINHLMDEEARAAEELRIAEFNSLQSQINPHFLYNTMDMINWLSKQGRSDEVTAAIQRLSKFYKLTLSKKRKVNTIEDELLHVSLYVELQNMRYLDMIDFLVDVPDNMMEYQIPKLTFQPVVENAILHGILEKETKKGSIVITGWEEDDCFVILISDDGVGISQEKLASILTGEGTSKTGSNIAVCNTHKRLQLLYGSSFGLTYRSKPGEGTEVEIRLPLEQNLDLSKEDRLEHALHLLTRPDINMFHIAAACGYDSTTEFFDEFKSKYGCTPEEYRARLL